MTPLVLPLVAAAGWRAAQDTIVPPPPPHLQTAVALGGDTAALVVHGATIAVVRPRAEADTPAERAEAAAQRIDAVLCCGAVDSLRVASAPEGSVVQAAGRPLFLVRAAHGDPARGETPASRTTRLPGGTGVILYAPGHDRLPHALAVGAAGPPPGGLAHPGAPPGPRAARAPDRAVGLLRGVPAHRVAGAPGGTEPAAVGPVRQHPRPGASAGDALPPQAGPPPGSRAAHEMTAPAPHAWRPDPGGGRSSAEGG